MKRLRIVLTVFLALIFLCSCEPDGGISAESFAVNLQNLCPEMKLSLEAENLSQAENGIVHTIFAESKENTYLLTVLSDAVTGEVKSCTVTCSGKEIQKQQEYSKLCLSVFTAFTEKNEVEGDEFLKNLPLIVNDNRVHKSKTDKFILYSYPAANGYAFTIENSDKLRKEETTALTPSPELNPVTMETLTIPKPR